MFVSLILFSMISNQPMPKINSSMPTIPNVLRTCNNVMEFGISVTESAYPTTLPFACVSCTNFTTHQPLDIMPTSKLSTPFAPISGGLEFLNQSAAIAPLVRPVRESNPQLNLLLAFFNLIQFPLVPGLIFLLISSPTFQPQSLMMVTLMMLLSPLCVSLLNPNPNPTGTESPHSNSLISSLIMCSLKRVFLMSLSPTVTLGSPQHFGKLCSKPSVPS